MLTRSDAGAPPAQLTSVICHELVSPLATALWYIGIAERHCAPPAPLEARAALVLARGQIEDLHRLLARVIELDARGKPEIRPVETDLVQLARQTLDRLTLGRPEAHAISLCAPAAVAGAWDPGVVDQILRNLVSNAIKFGRGRPIDVEVSAARHGGCLTVRDSGDGISAREQRRIFERHVCAPRAAGGGLGLGLWLVKELARAHGGRVTVRSRPGVGSTFQVFVASRAERVAAKPVSAAG